MALSGVYPATLEGVRFEDTSTTALFPVGQVCLDNFGGIWTYGKASGAIVVYSLCTVLVPGVVVTADTTSCADDIIHPLGANQVAIADASYGWFWRGPGGFVGSGIKILFAGAAVNGVRLYQTAAGTTGQIDDAVVAKHLIQGLRTAATVASGVASEVIACLPMTVVAQD